MYTTKTGAAALGAVALLVALTACAGVRGNDAQPANLPQSQHELQQSARQESDAMRAEFQAAAATTTVQSLSTVEGIRTAKQSEARAVVGPSPAEAQGERLAKYAAALTAGDAQRRHLDVEHGASSERLR